MTLSLLPKMSIKSDLICPICKEIFEEPIFFPCHCTFCKKHADELIKENKNTGKCQVCKEEFDIPKQGFKENSRIKMIIEKDAHLSEEEKVLKKSIRQSPLDYERLVEEIETKEKEFEIKRYEHFSEIRRNIDLRRENLKLRIDKIAEELIDEAKVMEDIYKKKIIENNKIRLSKEEFASESEELIKLFRNPNMVLNALESNKVKLDFKIKDLEEKLKTFIKIRGELKNYKFEKHFEIESDFFGKLKDEDKEEVIDHQIAYIVNEENYIHDNLATNDPYAYIFRLHDEYLATENYNYVG